MITTKSLTLTIPVAGFLGLFTSDATVNCTVNWKGSNSMTDWSYKFDHTGFQVSY